MSSFTNNVTSRKKPRSLFDPSASNLSNSTLNSPQSTSLLPPSSPKRRKSASFANLGSPSFDIELSPPDGLSVELSSPELSQVGSLSGPPSGGGGGEGFTLGGDGVEDGDEEDGLSEVGEGEENEENEEDEENDEEEELLDMEESDKEEEWEDENEISKAEVREELADLNGTKVPNVPKIPKKRGPKKGSKNRPKGCPPPPKPSNPFEIGDKVSHPEYGDGTVKLVKKKGFLGVEFGCGIKGTRWRALTRLGSDAVLELIRPQTQSNPFEIGDKVSHPEYGDGTVNSVKNKGFLGVEFGCGIKGTRWRNLTRLGSDAVLDLTRPPTPVKIGRGDWVTHGEWGRGRVKKVKAKSWTNVVFEEGGAKSCRMTTLTFVEHGIWEESESESESEEKEEEEDKKKVKEKKVELEAEELTMREIDHGELNEDPADGRTWRVRVASKVPSTWKVGEEVKELTGPALGSYMNSLALRSRVRWYLQCRVWSRSLPRKSCSGSAEGGQGPGDTGGGGKAQGSARGIWIVAKDSSSEDVRAEVCMRYGSSFALVRGSQGCGNWILDAISGGGVAVAAVIAMMGREEITGISATGDEGMYTIYGTTVLGNLLCWDIRMSSSSPSPSPLLLPSPTWSTHTGTSPGEESNCVSIFPGRCPDGFFDSCVWTGDDEGRVIRWDRRSSPPHGAPAGGGGRGRGHGENSVVTCAGVRRGRGKKVRGGQVATGGTDCGVVLWEERGGKWEGVDKVDMGEGGGDNKFANPPFVNGISWRYDDLACALGDGTVSLLRYRGSNKRAKVKSGLVRDREFSGGHGGG
ncbi:hypothetical protein TrRE_jg1239, partial [Triparma retinervis]